MKYQPTDRPPTCCCGERLLRYRCPTCGYPNPSWPDAGDVAKWIGKFIVGIIAATVITFAFRGCFGG